MATKKTASKTTKPAAKKAATKAPAKKAPATKKATSAKAPKAGATYAELKAADKGASKIENPVFEMWTLCDKMQNSRRKDVIAAAVAKGIAFGTARTQYQLWLTAFRNSK